jgi:RNA-binding protein 5/10
MKSSSGPNVEGAKGMKRIILIKDKQTLASLGFAFVEFVDVQVCCHFSMPYIHSNHGDQKNNAQSAGATLAATMSPQIHPSGFRISDRPVAASWGHQYSFQPVEDALRDESAVSSSVALGGSEGHWVRYWDETTTVAVLEFEVETPQPTAASGKDKEKKKKTKGKYPILLHYDLYIIPCSFGSTCTC